MLQNIPYIRIINRLMDHNPVFSTQCSGCSLYQGLHCSSGCHQPLAPPTRWLGNSVSFKNGCITCGMSQSYRIIWITECSKAVTSCSYSFSTMGIFDVNPLCQGQDSSALSGGSTWVALGPVDSKFPKFCVNVPLIVAERTDPEEQLLQFWLRHAKRSPVLRCSTFQGHTCYTDQCIWTKTI